LPSNQKLDGLGEEVEFDFLSFGVPAIEFVADAPGEAPSTGSIFHDCDGGHPSIWCLPG
jgi:hypothetical protein